MSNRIHELKTWPEPYEAIAEGRKPFEVRWDDRDFQVGDYLLLQEFIPGHDPEYTGREIMRQVTFVLAGGQFDLPIGVVVMGLVDHGRVDALERELLRCSEHLRDFAAAHPLESSTDIDGALYCAEQLLNRTAKVTAKEPALEWGGIDDALTAAWNRMLELDDRNSPEEYPEMILITREELERAMVEAADSIVPPSHSQSRASSERA